MLFGFVMRLHRGFSFLAIFIIIMFMQILEGAVNPIVVEYMSSNTETAC